MPFISCNSTVIRCLEKNAFRDSGRSWLFPYSPFNITYTVNTPVQIYLRPKKENFHIKILIIFFHISAQNIDCGYTLEPPRRGGSNEYPQSMF